MMTPVNLPAEIHFGRGIRNRLIQALPPGPVLFIAGKHSRKRIEEEMIPRLEGREFRLFCGVSPEPPLEEVEQARELGREIGAVLDLSESRVCQIMSQAMARLRSMLKDWRN